MVNQKKQEYYDCGATFNVGQKDEFYVSDKDVAEFTDKHMRSEDKQDIRKVTECALLSFCMLSGSVEPLGDNEFFYNDLE